MNRRDFLLLGLASSVAPVFAAKGYLPDVKSQQSKTALISAFSKDEQHFIGKYDLATDRLSTLQIPFRAHDMLLLGSDQVLSFGRRPINQCVFSDLKTQQQTLIDAASQRHFYGHGCLDQTKKTLFTTENDYTKAQGRIGIRDAESFEQLGEFSSYGIGPHDIHLMPDNKTLVVANGGIQTHPDFGRRKLNLKSMQPSLVFIDIQSGKKVDEYRMENHLLSIRHLAVADDGQIGASMQYQGSLYKEIPNTLLAWFDGSRLNELTFSQERIKQCQGYIADLAIDPKNKILAATSPRGNNVSLWDIQEKSLLSLVELNESSGIVFDAEKCAFLVSNANGDIYQISQNQSKFLATRLQVFPGMSWDNHMVMKT